MARPIHIKSLVVANTTRPLLATTNALRRFATTTPRSAKYEPSKPRFFSTTQSNKFANTSSKMVVHDIQGQKNFDATIAENPLVVVDFFATWCGPCKVIAPKISEWSNQDEFSNVKFVKVDVDESPDVAQDQGIRAMPTFYIFKGGEKVGDLVGADPKKLQELIKSHM